LTKSTPKGILIKKLQCSMKRNIHFGIPYMISLNKEIKKAITSK
jgi:hypothetical protein